MAQVIVLCGGTSPERAVSLRSGSAVAAALTARGHDVRLVDPKDGLQQYGAELEQAEVVFPVLHGAGGEDGTAQQILEAIHVPYVGSSAAASALCFNKQSAKKRLQEAGITVPQGAVVTIDTLWESSFTLQPFVLKPLDGGSSIDTFIVRDVSLADKLAIEHAFRTHSQMLLEELIDGVEVTVGVLGETALPPVEIIPPKGAEFDYENKYNGKTTELCPPKHLTSTQQQTAQTLAVEVHHILGCRDISRTDFIMDASGTLYTLETNTLPGMTDQSLVPKAAETAGISMQELTDRLLHMALTRGPKP